MCTLALHYVSAAFHPADSLDVALCHLSADEQQTELMAYLKVWKDILNITGKKDDKILDFFSLNFTSFPVN